jgi:hypothetical protein
LEQVQIGASTLVSFDRDKIASYPNRVGSVSERRALRFPSSIRDRAPAPGDVPLSARRLRALADAERLILWALRHRIAEGDPASPQLVNAFDVLCGPAVGSQARAALERLVTGLETFARRPLAVLDWCNDALTADEAALLALCADASTGRATSAALSALVVHEGTAAVGEAVRALVHDLAAAGLQLPLAGPTTPPGEHDVADQPFTLH